MEQNQFPPSGFRVMFFSELVLRFRNKGHSQMNVSLRGEGSDTFALTGSKGVEALSFRV